MGNFLVKTAISNTSHWDPRHNSPNFQSIHLPNAEAMRPDPLAIHASLGDPKQPPRLFELCLPAFRTRIEA